MAVAPQPDLLLLDEPAASLDPVARHDFLQLLMELIQTEGRTILISSHVLSDVEKVVDTVLVINGGRVHCHQPLDELRETYHRVDLEAVGGELPDPLPLPGLLTVTGDRRRAMAVCGHVPRREVETAAADPGRGRAGARPGVRGDLPADRHVGREEGMSIPTLVPRDLLPRPEWTALRIAGWSAVPILILFALLIKGVPRQSLLLVLVFIAGQASLALAQGQKEMLAATSSYFRPGLGRRAGQAQAFWAMMVPTVTTLVYAVLAPGMGTAVLLSTFGLMMMVHAALSLATYRLWWAFQLPAFAFYIFFIPAFIRGGATADRMVAAAHQPIPWLVGGGVSAWLLVRYASSRALQRRLHDTIVLGPEAIFRPSRVQEYKDRHRRRDRRGGGSRLQGRLLAGITGRAAAARRRGDVLAAQRWRLMAVNTAVETSPRWWMLPLVTVATLAMMIVTAYVSGRDPEDPAWYGGLVYQVALFPFFHLATSFLGAPMTGASRRIAWRAETSVLLMTMLVSVATALLIRAVSGTLAGFMPAVTWHGELRHFRVAPLHGVWVAPLAACFGWFALALRPRPRCSLPIPFIFMGFYAGHALGIFGSPALAAAIYGGAAALAFLVALFRRRRWWLRADLPA